MSALLGSLTGSAALNMALLFEASVILLDLIGLFAFLLHLGLAVLVLLIADKVSWLTLWELNFVGIDPAKAFKVCALTQPCELKRADRAVARRVMIDLAIGL